MRLKRLWYNYSKYKKKLSERNKQKKDKKNIFLFQSSEKYVNFEKDLPLMTFFEKLLDHSEEMETES